MSTSNGMICLSKMATSIYHQGSAMYSVQELGKAFVRWKTRKGIEFGRNVPISPNTEIWNESTVPLSWHSCSVVYYGMFSQKRNGKWEYFHRH